MSDFETRTPEQLTRAAAISRVALAIVQEPGGPTQSIEISKLLGQLISTEEATATEAELQLLLDYAPNAIGLVFADPEPAKSGWYRKTGAVGAGNWVQFEKLSAQALADVEAVRQEILANADRTEAAAQEFQTPRVVAGRPADAVLQTGGGGYIRTIQLPDALPIGGKLRVEIGGSSASTVARAVLIKRFTVDPVNNYATTQTGPDISILVPPGVVSTFDIEATGIAGERVGWYDQYGAIKFTSGADPDSGYQMRTGNQSSFNDVVIYTAGRFEIRFSVISNPKDDVARIIAPVTKPPLAYVPVGGMETVPNAGTGAVPAAGTYQYYWGSPVAAKRIRIRAFGGQNSGYILVRLANALGAVKSRNIYVPMTAGQLTTMTVDLPIAVGDRVNFIHPAGVLTGNNGPGSFGGWHSYGGYSMKVAINTNPNLGFDFSLSVEALIDEPLSIATGQKIVCMGDSITEFGNYPQVVSGLLGAHVVGGGIGGSTMANYSDLSDPTVANYSALSMAKRAEAIATGDYTAIDAAVTALAPGDDNRGTIAKQKLIDWANTDVMTVFFGANDFAGNIPLGVDGSTDPATFIGAINYIVSTIQPVYPNLQINFIAPYYRSRRNSGDGQNSDDFPNNLGTYYIEYVDAILRTAAANHCHAIDLYRGSGINKYNSARYLKDGLHPTYPLGYELIGRKIAGGLLS